VSAVPSLNQIADYEQSLQQWPELVASGLLVQPAIESLSLPLFAQRDVRVDVLRADLLHPRISGNKWFKLKYNLLQAREQGCQTLLSFGGAWSNHLHALAFAAHLVGMRSVGIVRGEELDAHSNPMLQEAQQWGMELAFVSRQCYREWTRTDGPAADAHTWIIPEGGDNHLGVLGCMSLVPRAAYAGYDQVWLALGTGCTLAGVRLALPPTVNVCGVSVLAGDWPRQQMQERLQQWNWHEQANWDVLTQYHAGGYGRAPAAVLSFVAEFGDNTGVPLEPVYTGKAMQALCDQVQRGIVSAGTRVLFIHTGGLQGARGFSSSTG